ncbi:31590_t:CDS:1, partial [Gigaspora margarita]
FLLDPWLKTLSNWDEETQERTKEKLKYQFSNCKQTIASEHTATSKNINTHYNRLRLSIFGLSISRNTMSNPLAELECYLDPMQTLITKDIKDPFE